MTILDGKGHMAELSLSRDLFLPAARELVRKRVLVSIDELAGRLVCRCCDVITTHPAVGVVEVPFEVNFTAGSGTWSSFTIVGETASEH